MIVLSAGGWILFAIQFFWQFPHFWAIAWIAHKDYTAAGFKLLPSGEGQTKYSAIQAVIYSLLLLPVGIIPYFNGMSGLVSLVHSCCRQFIHDRPVCAFIQGNDGTGGEKSDVQQLYLSAGGIAGFADR